MTGLRLVDHKHPVAAFGPAVPSSAAPPYANLAEYNHITILIEGVNGGSGVTASAVTVNQAQDVSGTGAKALPITQVWQCNDAAAGDALAQNAVSNNTFTLPATASKRFLAILEIDTAELDVANGYQTVAVELADAAAQTVSVTYLLGGARVGGSYASFPSALS